MSDTMIAIFVVGTYAGLFLFWAVRFERALFGVRFVFAGHRLRSRATIWHLREALQDMVDTHPCKTPNDTTCHCPTCLGHHALAASSGAMANNNSATGAGEEG